MRQSKVRIFSLASCPHCFALMEFLKAKGIEFEEIDVSKDEKTRKEMIKKSGRLEVPIIEIDGQTVVGFDKEKICKLLNIKD